jgi:two-component system, cell cycle sensor histidine kinase and response regulator CckA
MNMDKFFSEANIAIATIEISKLNLFCKYFKKNTFDIENFIQSQNSLYDSEKENFNFIFANQQALNIFGCKNLFILNKKKKIIFKNKLNIFENELISNILSNKNKFNITINVKNLRNENINIYLYCSYLNNISKNEILLFLVDMTQYINEVLKNKRLKYKYNFIFDSISESYLIVNIFNDYVIECNRYAKIKIFDDIKYIKYIKHYDIVEEKNKKKYLQFYYDFLKKYGDLDEIQTTVVNNINQIFPVSLTVSRFSGEKNFVLIKFKDISDVITIENRRKLLSTAIDQVAESIVITDVYGKIQYVNPAFEKTSGYIFPEVIGRKYDFINNDDSSKIQYKSMWQKSLSGEVWRGILTNKKQDGSIYKEEATVTPVKDSHGNIINFVTVKRDITEHLLLENQIRQSQKMQAIGTLAGGIAHDFNNILTAILGYAELTQVQCNKGSLLYENLEEIVRAADRAGKLVDQILKFSRQGEKNISNFEISLIIKEAIKLLRASLPANIELLVDLVDTPLVKADPTQAHQIIMNLCTNAYQALDGKAGTIKIRLQTVHITMQQGIEIGNLEQGRYACLQVEDDGHGIPPELMERIFEPYFTTKKIGAGTGLGLSVVHGIVTDHGGAVTVESTVGSGTCFFVYLPEASGHEYRTKKNPINQLIDGV